MQSNFYTLIACCFQVIAGQTWQNFTSKNKPHMSDLFHDVTKAPMHVKSMAYNENSTSSYVALNND